MPTFKKHTTKITDPKTNKKRCCYFRVENGKVNKSQRYIKKTKNGVVRYVKIADKKQSGGTSKVTGYRDNDEKAMQILGLMDKRVHKEKAKRRLGISYAPNSKNIQYMMDHNFHVDKFNIPVSR